MYTFKQWEDFCRTFSSLNSVLLISVNEAKDVSDRTRLIIKHDVECQPENALRTAQIENKYGIKATYYFHGFFTRSAVGKKVIFEIASLGHEVGYHYDVLDAHNGDYDSAATEFSSDLCDFDKLGTAISTICPHGNPVKSRVGWNSNKDFFKNERVLSRFCGIFDVVNNIDKMYVDYYVSDAGYSLQKISDIKNNDKPDGMKDVPIDMDDIVTYLNEKKSIVLSVHTHRLSKSKIELYCRKYLFFTLRNTVRVLSKAPFIKRVLSPFFRIAKKF